MPSSNRTVRAGLALAFALTLPGCAELVIGGAVVGGALVATDRRTLGAQTEDAAIELKGGGRVMQTLGGAGHVNVHSFNRHVLLTGEVVDASARSAVEREIECIEGVQAVVNALEIGSPSGFGSRSLDVLIEAKVKASLVDAKDVSANAIKVVVERGSVFLMGRVTPHEGKRAADIAAGVADVRQVVTSFEAISEDELRRLANR